MICSFPRKGLTFLVLCLVQLEMIGGGGGGGGDDDDDDDDEDDVSV